MMILSITLTNTYILYIQLVTPRWHTMALPMKGGKPRNLLVEKSFTIVINPKFKGARAECKYCHKELDRNASRLQIHLDDCIMSIELWCVPDRFLDTKINHHSDLHLKSAPYLLDNLAACMV